MAISPHIVLLRTGAWLVGASFGLATSAAGLAARNRPYQADADQLRKVCTLVDERHVPLDDIDHRRDPQRQSQDGRHGQHRPSPSRPVHAFVLKGRWYYLEHDWVAREGAGIEFCTINPSVVLGPVWSRDYSASVVILRKLLDGSLRGCPDIGFGVVDVRDVADLHVRALKAPGMAGERFIASGRFMKLLEIAEVLRAALGPHAGKVPTRNLPDWLVRVTALFDRARCATRTHRTPRRFSAGPRGRRSKASSTARAASSSWASSNPDVHRRQSCPP